MKKLFRCSTLLLTAGISLFSCSKKSDNVNNSQVIATPYSLYFTDSSGVLYNSNDGRSSKIVFTSDGRPSRALIAMGGNLMWIKGQDIPMPGPTMYYSINEGKNFNHCFDSITSIPMVSNTGKTINLNQSMIAYVTAWDAAYCVTNNPDGQNIFGLAGNPLKGLPGFWTRENYYDTDQITFPHDITATSLTVLKKDMLIAYDAVHNRCFNRSALLIRWKESFAGANTLPVASATTFFSIGHYNNRVIAIDNIGGSATSGNSNVYYSDDNGSNWFPYSGIPIGIPLQCISSPFEQVCLVGTDGMGIYMLNPNTGTFEARNNGLPANSSVRGITFKENIYKNGVHTQYVYATTNTGLYVSTDMGNSWVKTIPGNFVSIY